MAAVQTDHKGQLVPEGEGPDTPITVWEMEPHFSGDYTHCVERSWQGIVSIVKHGIEGWLEHFSDDELREGVTLTFRLKTMPKGEYEEAVANV